MSELPDCPECSSSYACVDGAMLVCPECGYEWSPGESGNCHIGALKLKSAFVKKA